MSSKSRVVNSPVTSKLIPASQLAVLLLQWGTGWCKGQWPEVVPEPTHSIQKVLGHAGTYYNAQSWSPKARIQNFCVSVGVRQKKSSGP
ncbi:uncharacterized protein CLAFUR5_20059 [Fulvia fulva]|uniref:uncharacterized protein n=1 Tax=Passalora fulva TaxID=5499 RepID=UPI00285250C9|nr:uncharacterized protein CLAFUR5_20059 [Fulvia fulva]KAK4623473.1 hypothetical protein CLAFUR0_20059 [Fulvia fulva]WMI38937.1 hypothetical protein CLAFUR5_20059 [Fulvia fulva]WPV31096.1 hypothetical protein CLAFUW7_20059 [Fulvia fulva]